MKRKELVESQFLQGINTKQKAPDLNGQGVDYGERERLCNCWQSPEGGEGKKKSQNKN